MDEYRQVLEMIDSGRLSREQLKGFLQKAQSQLAGYAEAKKLIESTPEEDWNYDLYVEALRIGSGGIGSEISREVWNQMFPDTRKQSMQGFLKTIEDGRRMFENIEAKVKEALTEKNAPLHVDATNSAKSRKTAASKSGCYIATAVYGSYDAPAVKRLRQFRDQCLMPARSGRAAVKFYYRLSPRLAGELANVSSIRRIIRFLLDAFVRLLKP